MTAATFSQVRQALATTLGSISGLRVSPTYVGQVNPPMAVVMPAPGQMLLFQTMDGGVQWTTQVTFIASAADDPSGQTLLDGWLSTDGSQSVNQALLANPTLGHVVDYAVVQSALGYGFLNWAGITYYGVRMIIVVGAE